VEAGGVTWAYRKSEAAEAKADPAKPQVLLLHGLGSSSYSYRCGEETLLCWSLCNCFSGQSLTERHSLQLKL
jgi:pimeloyl-ACP methyl ester carboxylesterase